MPDLSGGSLKAEGLADGLCPKGFCGFANSAGFFARISAEIAANSDIPHPVRRCPYRGLNLVRRHISAEFRAVYCFGNPKKLFPKLRVMFGHWGCCPIQLKVYVIALQLYWLRSG